MKNPGFVQDDGARSGSAGMEVMELDNGGIARSLNGNLRHHYEASFRLIGSQETLEGNCSSLKMLKYTGGFSYDIKDMPLKYKEYKYRPTGEDGGVANGDYAAFGYFIGAILDRLIAQREELMLLAEDTRIKATSYTYLRNMSVFRQYLIDLRDFIEAEIASSRKPEFDITDLRNITGERFKFLQ